MDLKDKLVESHQDNDGIREYDNPLPLWFVYMFLGSIVFAFIYSAYYYGHAWAVSRAAGVGMNLSTSGATYLASVRRAESLVSKAATVELQGEALVALLKAPTTIAKGEGVFRTNCVACHGDQGQGVVGPNLTDPFWLHGGMPDAIVKSISGGYPDKGMPGWKPTLGAEKVRQAAAYVMSLRGRTVANPKAPQGEKEP